MLFVDGGGGKILQAVEDPVYIFYGFVYQIAHQISEFGIQLIN